MALLQPRTMRLLLASTMVSFLFPVRAASLQPHRSPTSHPTAADVIAALNLTANPEKGYFVQTFEDPASVTFTVSTSGSNSNGSAVVSSSSSSSSSNNQNTTTSRSASTAIYYLLEGAAGDSLWHRIDAVEVWHHYAGAPLRLRQSRGGGDDDDGGGGAAVVVDVLGPDVLAGQRPQVVVGRWRWQSARSLGDWTFVGTTGNVVSYFLFSSLFFFFFSFWCLFLVILLCSSCVLLAAETDAASGRNTVAPAFSYDGYEIQAEGWQP